MSNFAIKINSDGDLITMNEHAGWKTMTPKDFIKAYGDGWFASNKEDGSWVSIKKQDDDSIIIEFGEPGA